MPISIGAEHANSHELLIGQPGKGRVGDRLQSIAILNRPLRQLGDLQLIAEISAAVTPTNLDLQSIANEVIEDRVDGTDRPSLCNRLQQHLRKEPFVINGLYEVQSIP